MSEILRLEFTDFVDLQTRLVLLPRVEEEGIGAVVAAYKPLLDDSRQEKENKAPERRSEVTKEEPRGPDGHTEQHDEEGNADNDLPQAHEDSVGQEGRSSFDNIHSEEKKKDASVKIPASKSKDETVPGVVESETSSQHETDHDAETSSQGDSTSSSEHVQHEVVGMVLIGLVSKDDSEEEDWKNKEFTSILADIRQALTPIVLLFSPAEDESSNDSSKDDDEQAKNHDVDDNSTISSAHSAHADEEDETPLSPNTKGSMLGVRLSSWGSQIRATSAILAAEAASGAASLSTAVKTAAAERAKSGGKAAENRPVANQGPLLSEISLEKPSCALFLQCSPGKFVEVPEKPTVSTVASNASTISSESAVRITTSSLLAIRQSADEPCPPRGYQFQWYRSCENPSEVCSVSSLSGSGGSRSHHSREPSHGPESVASMLEWTVLPGANFAAYQPNATDVGHHLRCEVTPGGVVDSPEDDGDCKEITTVCETHDIVAADMSLFNGARQALGRGAVFGNIQGRGNAEGRIFRLHVEITRITDPERKTFQVASALTIYQVSGNTAEKMHQQPITRPTAIADPSQAKAFDLVFPCEDDSMLSALSTDGRFQLSAPNRITRETFLLSLGIANYKGRPANLDATTVLFPGSPFENIREIVSETVVGLTPVRSNKADDTLSFFTPPDEYLATPEISGGAPADGERMQRLEAELQALRTKLMRKDKVVSDLQRQITGSEKLRRKAESALSHCQTELETSRRECRETHTSLRRAEKRIETHEDTLQRLKGDSKRHVALLEQKISSQAEKIADLEKNTRSLQNEKAVLSAAVEARDSKLSKMSEMQKVVDALSEKVSRGDALRNELNDMSQRYAEISKEMEKVSRFERECRDELRQALSTVEELNDRLGKEQQKTAGCQTQLESLQVKIQQLKAERNSYKQKADSLSKEVSRICRRGRTVKDIEKIIADEEARKMEVSLLKSQKKQALQDLHHYRTSYEQSQIAQQRAGVDGEAMRALEQKAELERVVAELTEYVEAKEMQLETLMQVNHALTEELHQLAQASMSKNDI